MSGRAPRPALGHRVVALVAAGRPLAEEAAAQAADRVEVPIQLRERQVAPGGGHLGAGGPLVGRRVIGKHSAPLVASAVLAASIFHYGEHTIGEAKRFMAAAGLPMRLDP